MPASGCIENEYGKGKENVLIHVHFKNANILAVGDTTYVSFANVRRPLHKMIQNAWQLHEFFGGPGNKTYNLRQQNNCQTSHALNMVEMMAIEQW